ncbi:MAG: SpoIIE family protein phosphatase [Clostridia bacterium]|nr:SpoIIE family protein phosphatase [Clostridia bacterium]
MKDIEGVKAEGREPFASAVKAGLEGELGLDKNAVADHARILSNIAIVALGFLFGGCHLVFGSYPLGLALVSLLPRGVWSALIGVAIGSLTLGRSGIIYAMISVLAVFLRIVISGKEKGAARLFSESILLRTSSAVISGFVSAVYEILLSGFSLESILLGASMIILPGAVTLALSGLFVGGISMPELLFGKDSAIFSKKDDGIKLTLFRASALILILLISLSLDKYSIFGIDLSFVFAGLVTIVAAKRFGALYAAVVGFFASVGVSGLYSVAFALAGAVSGAIFSLGGLYALISGLAALSLWGAYAGGVSGFLSVFPEHLIACCLSFPLFKYIEREKGAPRAESVRRKATDMVGTMALAHRNKISSLPLELEKPLSAVLPIIKDFCNDDSAAEDYTIFLRMLTEARAASQEERDMNEELTDKLENIIEDFGFKDGVVRAFGKKRPYVVLAGEDKDGVRITDPALKARLEGECGVKLSRPEYFRRDDMVLMECSSEPKYRIKSGSAKMASAKGEVSGDTARVFENGGFAYGLISDGMGSGEVAKRTSEFVGAFLSSMLGSGASDTTVMHALNSAIRRGKDECSATVDLFILDTVSASASFIKSGSASSYIKRDSSLFRIRSETMPIGLLKQIDAEVTGAEVLPGDFVIMMSDGICPSGDDAAWLPELLRRPIEGDLNAYASLIIEEAVKNGAGSDDMSVLILGIEKNE